VIGGRGRLKCWILQWLRCLRDTLDGHLPVCTTVARDYETHRERLFGQRSRVCNASNICSSNDQVYEGFGILRHKEATTNESPFFVTRLFRFNYVYQYKG